MKTENIQVREKIPVEGMKGSLIKRVRRAEKILRRWHECAEKKKDFGGVLEGS